MHADRPALGIALMIGFCAVAPIGDSVAKLLGPSMPLVQLILVRFAAQIVLLLPIIWVARISFAMSTRVFWLAALRTMFHLIAMGFMFSSLWFLPLADAVAICFVLPFIMLLLGRFVLGEEVGPRRLTACAVGFVGTLLVVQPSFATVGWPALLPLMVALLFAFYMLISRQIAKQADPLALQVVGGIVAIPVLLLVIAAGAGSSIEMLTLKMPDRGETMLLCTIAVAGTLAHVLMTWALRFAPSATLAPVQYLEIPFATFAGWLVFGDLPNGLASLGIAITIAAGLYIVWRERQRARPPIPADV